MYMYICTYLSLYLSIYLSIHLFISVYMCIYIYICCLYVYIHIFAYTCTYKYVHICIHVYINMCICTHICIMCLQAFNATDFYQSSTWVAAELSEPLQPSGFGHRYARALHEAGAGPEDPEPSVRMISNSSWATRPYLGFLVMSYSAALTHVLSDYQKQWHSLMPKDQTAS